MDELEPPLPRIRPPVAGESFPKSDLLHSRPPCQPLPSSSRSPADRFVCPRCFVAARVWCSTISLCGRAPPLRSWAALQKEREATQALLEEKEREAEQRTARLMEEKEREAEERTARLMEEKRARNDASTRAMYELIVSMCEKVGQAPPPMPAVVTTPATNNSRTASHHPGPGGSAPGVTGPMNPDASPPC